MAQPVRQEPLHSSILPDDGKAPADWTLADWQGVLEELDYQSDNVGRDTHNGSLFALAHDGLTWLVAYYLARRLNA